MRRTILASVTVGLSVLGLATLVSTPGAAAPPKPKPAAPQPDTPAPQVQTLAPLMEGFHFGVSHVEVTKAYNQVNGIFDKEYNPRLAKMQPGVQMQAVESERDTRKLQFANNIIQFNDTPVFDTTGLKGEFAYKNHEFVQMTEAPAYRRLFFYMGAAPGDRFWKMYTEYKYSSGAVGKSYPECVQFFTGKVGGSAGRARNPDPEKWLYLPFTEWQDGTTHIRVIDRSNEGICGVALEDLRTYNSLKSLRPQNVEDPTAMDPSVAAITRGGISDPSGKHEAAAADAGAPKKGPKGNKK